MTDEKALRVSDYLSHIIDAAQRIAETQTSVRRKRHARCRNNGFCTSAEPTSVVRAKWGASAEPDLRPLQPVSPGPRPRAPQSPGR
jgi:hypothetical protein